MAAQPEARSTDGETRRQIMLLLLKHSPLSASDIGDHLGLSAAGVRRHLDNLVEDELAEIIPTRPHPGGGRGRGRPAKSFRLTDKGRAHFGHDYDSLAALAITALRDAGGDEAVRQFARDRIAAILEDVVPAGSTEESIEATARALMDAFSAHGYATTVHNACGGVQICQHHCPISHVASEFPELCEAEHEAIAELLGQHVQPLATIIDGHGVCTTNIPPKNLTLTPINHTPDERSGT